MLTLAACIIVAGVLATVFGAMQQQKAGRLANVPVSSTGDVAGNADAVSAEGTVVCPAPLLSPVTQTACLYYEVRVVGSWKDGNQRKSKEYLLEKRAAAFGIDDGSGEVAVAANDGGDFEPFAKTFEETKKEGFFADLKAAVGKGKPIVFGKFAFRNPSMSKADTFTCVEKVMTVQPKLFVLGKCESGVITAPKWRSLILSSRSREQLLASTATNAKRFLIGGSSTAFTGALMAMIAALVAPTVSKAQAPAASPVAIVAPAAIDSRDRASITECMQFVDAVYSGRKLQTGKRVKEVKRCTQQLTSGQVACTLAAKSLPELQRCMPAPARSSTRRSQGRR